MVEERHKALREALEEIGDTGFNNQEWRKFDYIGLTGATKEDIPFLAEVMAEWLEDVDWDDEDESLWAPVHAWRTLSHLGQPEALNAILSMLDPMDKQFSDLMLEEFPYLLSFIGPSGISKLAEYFAEEWHEVFALVAVAHGLCEIAKDYPEYRDTIIAVLSKRLDNYEINDPALNTLIISYLLELKAVEKAELIEQVFAADCVDVMIMGNWNDVKRDFGLKEIGLVSEELASKRITLFDGFKKDKEISGIGVGRRAKRNVSYSKEKRKKRKKEKAKRKRRRRR